MVAPSSPGIVDSSWAGHDPLGLLSRTMTADEVTKQIDEMTARCAVELRADTQRNLQQLHEVRVGFNEWLRTYWGVPRPLRAPVRRIRRSALTW